MKRSRPRRVTGLRVLALVRRIAALAVLVRRRRIIALAILVRRRRIVRLPAARSADHEEDDQSDDRNQG
jgi:hypothetical protein